MKVLLLSPTVDTAGLGIGLKRAFDAHGGDWTAHHVRTANSWLNYDVDIQWDRNDPAQTAEVNLLWAQADVVVIIEQPLSADWFPAWPRKPIIVYHLGTWYRRQPDVVHAQCQRIGAIEVVDMHDLMRFGVERWLPDVIDPKPLADIRAREWQPSDRIRITHAPTDRTIKSTDAVVAAVERLSAKYPIDFDLIERVPNAECLARKARSDIFIDELTLGYGLNALECWSMGMPVVSGIANLTTRDRMIRDFGRLPFVNATAETLYEHVETLVKSPQDRLDWAARGKEHIARFHSPQAVVSRLKEFSELAIRS